MGIFDRFKKKESYYDSTNIKVHDLDVGFVFDYDMSTWEVKGIFEYDWGNNYFTREFKIDNGIDTLFLYIEEDDELFISVSKKIKVRALGEDVMDGLMSNQKAPKKVTYDGRDYFLDGETPGYFHDISKGPDAWEEFISWDYEDDSEDFIVCIEQWGEKEFEASAGKYIKEFEISNILPGDQS